MPQRLIPQAPLRASRIANTGRLTHGHYTNTLTRKCRLNAPHDTATRHDGQDDDVMPRLQRCQLIDTMTRRDASACLPIRQTERRTLRRILLSAQRHADTGCTAERTDDGTKDRKNEPPRKTWNGSKNKTINDMTTTRHQKRKQNHPASGGNQATENDSTHTAHASSQSPQEYHQSTKS